MYSFLAAIIVIMLISAVSMAYMIMVAHKRTMEVRGELKAMIDILFPAKCDNCKYSPYNRTCERCKGNYNNDLLSQ